MRVSVCSVGGASGSPGGGGIFFTASRTIQSPQGSSVVDYDEFIAQARGVLPLPSHTLFCVQIPIGMETLSGDAKYC
eukprot:6260471-Alexandrium_andersonii.AAC.1